MTDFVIKPKMHTLVILKEIYQNFVPDLLVIKFPDFIASDEEQT